MPAAKIQKIRRFSEIVSPILLSKRVEANGLSASAGAVWPCSRASLAKVKTNIIYENNLPLCQPNLALSLGGQSGPRTEMNSKGDERKEMR